MLLKLHNFFNLVYRLIFSKNAILVGTDQNDNRYYVSDKGKRWVVYSSKVAEPTTVTSKWHLWLHYSDDLIPDDDTKNVKHIPNLTGTENAYYPNQEINNYYKSWNPDQ